MKPQERVNVKSHTRTGTAAESVSEKMSTAVLAVTGTAGLAIGLWSVAALVGGLVAGGGPLGLASGYFKAVTGL